MEDNSLEWCRSFPPSNISSLKEFHVAFQDYCKDIFHAKFLYQEYCEEFYMLYHDSINKDQDISTEEKVNDEYLIQYDIPALEIGGSILLPFEPFDMVEAEELSSVCCN